MKRPSSRSLLTWLIVAALVAFAVYDFKFAPVPAVAHMVARGAIVGEVMGTGTLEARVKTTIGARIQERLTEVLADQGDTVKKDQLLARLDDSEIKQQVAVAAATLAAARSTAERVTADLGRSEAVLPLARLDHERTAGLLANKAVAKSDADKTAEGLRVAEADIKCSNAAIAEAQGQVVMAEKNLLYRKEQLASTQIHAPYDGLIIRRDRDPGDVLVPGASLMQIVAIDEIWVSAWVDETATPTLATGQPARIIFRSEPGRSYPGTVSRHVQVALEINDSPASKAREHALELLDYLGVRPRADNLPDALSGGEQQRVAIARALANAPSLILADEPTASLDSSLGRQVMELFAKVAHEREAGVLVVTHDSRTLEIFDRILDVEDGMIRSRTTDKDAASPSAS